MSSFAHSLLIYLILLTFSGKNAPEMGKDRDQNIKELYKIVLIAGPNDHCPHERPCHKYIQDMQLIRDCLGQLKSIDVEVQLYIGERPAVGSLDDVDAVVIHSGGDATEYEWHALFPQTSEAEVYQDPDYRQFLQYFDQQMERGMGLAVLHYATFIDHPEARRRYLQWIGGYYKDGVSEVDGDPTAPGSTAIESVTLATPEHPILKGVSPWTSEAEYYYRIFFGKGTSKPTPILTSALPVNDPKPETIAWALERSDGGRGFGFTGCHSHNNMYIEDFRKFVLNAILWVAGAEIPENGFSTILNKRYFK